MPDLDLNVTETGVRQTDSLASILHKVKRQGISDVLYKLYKRFVTLNSLFLTIQQLYLILPMEDILHVSYIYLMQGSNTFALCFKLENWAAGDIEHLRLTMDNFLDSDNW